jgi:predicted N-acetyltransferase YhbS
VRDGMEAARADGLGLVLLVGDEPYYARLGFVRVPAGHIALPGPVNPQRLLAVELRPGALADYRGMVTAAAQP